MTTLPHPCDFFTIEFSFCLCLSYLPLPRPFTYILGTLTPKVFPIFDRYITYTDIKIFYTVPWQKILWSLFCFSFFPLHLTSTYGSFFLILDHSFRSSNPDPTRNLTLAKFFLTHLCILIGLPTILFKFFFVCIPMFLWHINNTKNPTFTFNLSFLKLFKKLQSDSNSEYLAEPFLIFFI